MAPRFNPPPNWPAPPSGWTPPPGWRPDPAWGPPPAGWQLWIDDSPYAAPSGAVARTSPQSRAVWPAAVAGGVAAVVTFVAIGIGIAGGSESQNPAPPPTSQPRTVAEDADNQEEPGETVSTEAAEEASRAAAVEAEREAAEEAARVAAEEERRAAEEAAQAAEDELTDPENYESITDREWAQIERNPDAHVGERYVIYGHVFQFDANTGPTSFMALTSGQPKSNWWEYDIDTLVDGRSAETVEDVVEGDLVTLYVEVLGSTSYTTLIGGYNTTPHVQVNALSVDGSIQY